MKERTRERMGWKFKILILLLTLFLVWIFLAPYLANNLIVEKPLKKTDAVLVLSGSSVFTERVHKAAEVYKKEITKKVLLTDDGGYAGWSKKEQRNPKFVELAKKELIAQGVLEKDIEVLDQEVTGTIWEARALNEKIKKDKLKSVILVTSAYHSRRALWTFEELISNDVEIGMVSSPIGEQTPMPWTWWLSSRGWNLVAGEYVKMLVYWVYY